MPRVARALLGAATPLLLAGCFAGDPEIIVVNEIDEAVVVRQVSFNGCVWPGMLTFEDATSPRQCLPGADRIHFQRFDAERYCATHVGAGDLPEPCFCVEDDAPPEDPFELGIIDRTPLWFNYRTTYEIEAERGDFVRVVLRLGEHEQDFEVAGPYGH